MGTIQNSFSRFCRAHPFHLVLLLASVLSVSGCVGKNAHIQLDPTATEGSPGSGEVAVVGVTTLTRTDFKSPEEREYQRLMDGRILFDQLESERPKFRLMYPDTFYARLGGEAWGRLLDIFLKEGTLGTSDTEQFVTAMGDDIQYLILCRVETEEKDRSYTDSEVTIDRYTEELGDQTYEVEEIEPHFNFESEYSISARFEVYDCWNRTMLWSGLLYAGATNSNEVTGSTYSEREQVSEEEETGGILGSLAKGLGESLVEGMVKSLFSNPDEQYPEYPDREEVLRRLNSKFISKLPGEDQY